MTDYRIVCVTKSGGRIVEVGTGTEPNAAARQWTVQQVHDAIEKGDRFHTIGPTSNKRAEVETFVMIRTAGDSVQDNNLDNLRACSWKKS